MRGRLWPFTLYSTALSSTARCLSSIGQTEGFYCISSRSRHPVATVLLPFSTTPLQPPQGSLLFTRAKVLTFINSVTFVGSATEPRSRRDDEPMQGHRRGEATKRWARPAPTLRADGGCGRSLCLSSQPRLASPIRKRHRIYEREY